MTDRNSGTDHVFSGDRAHPWARPYHFWRSGRLLRQHKASNGRITRSWIQRLKVNGKNTHVGLGAYPLVGLAEARARALENLLTIKKGLDPRAGIPLFSEAAEQVIGIHAAGWKDHGKSEKQWRSSLRDYVLPTLGDKRVDQVTTADVMAVLIPHWQTKTETMRRVRQRIGAVMKWSIAQGYRDNDPTGPALTAAMPKTGGVREHLKALPYAEVSAALETVRQSGAYWATVACFEFMTLTATRSGEARLATWDEFDLKSATWEIPRERMKSKRPHRVPLARRLLDILHDAREQTGGRGLVFPSKTGRAMSDSTISKLVRENEIECVPHGMKSSARDWMSELTDYPYEVCELVLAHVNNNRIEAAYRRSDLYERRRTLMQDWANYVRADNVVPLRATG